MPVGKFQNPSAVFKAFQNLDSVHLHSFSAVISVLFPSPVADPQTSYAELFLTIWTQEKMYLFNKYLIIISFLEMC